MAESLSGLGPAQGDDMTTYDVYYTGLKFPQRLTNEYCTNPNSAHELIPGIIEHTESEIGYNIDDPECYEVRINSE